MTLYARGGEPRRDRRPRALPDACARRRRRRRTHDGRRRARSGRSA